MRVIHVRVVSITKQLPTFRKYLILSIIGANRHDPTSKNIRSFTQRTSSFEMRGLLYVWLGGIYSYHYAL